MNPGSKRDERERTKQFLRTTHITWLKGQRGCLGRFKPAGWNGDREGGKKKMGAKKEAWFCLPPPKKSQ